MGLIDADNFFKNLRYYLDRNFIGEISSQSTITIGELASLIKDEPTAYNIDIVTEELSEAIAIIRKVAGEYNNGWIPCSERLPRYEEDVLLYLNSYEVQMGYRAIQTGGDCFYIYMSCDFVDCEDVIAWQPLPQEYHPKGE